MFHVSSRKVLTLHCMNDFSKKPSVTTAVKLQWSINSSVKAVILHFWQSVAAVVRLQEHISNVAHQNRNYNGLCTFPGFLRPRNMVPLSQFYLTTRAFNLQALSILPIGNFSVKKHPHFFLPQMQIVIQRKICV